METMKRRETVPRGAVSSKAAPERVFFIVDRSRLKEESDELKDAVVVYMPDGDLKKPSLEQRCSQLIGISLLIFNFTSKLPKYIRLKSHGFAIRALGDTPCVMGLQSKFDEPKSCVISYLNRIHNFFMFSYSSLNSVMEMSHGDWEIFTIQMTTIFQSILDFTFRQNHTLPSMFSPLPYITLDSERGGSKLFLQAHRLLRNIQLKNSVIGGCLFYNKELLCSQLPPDISEKLLFVANGGVDLNRRSILDDQQMPESVWVIDIFLTPEELAILHQIQRPHNNIASFYSNLTPDPSLSRTVFTCSSRIKSNEELPSPYPPLPSPPPPPPIYRADSGGSADFVTISYSSVSYSAVHSNKVAPLKRQKKMNQRFSHSYEELSNNDKDYDEITSTPFYSSINNNNNDSVLSQNRAPPSYKSALQEIPPPLPPPRVNNSAEAPPPLPLRNLKGDSSHKEESHPSEEVPPPIPPRPGAPPVPKRNIRPVPPPRTTSANREEPRALVIGTQWMQGQEEEEKEESVGSPTSPSGIYGTPGASITEVLVGNERTRLDSEGSEGFGTPSSNSPVPLDYHTESMSTVTSDHNVSSSSYLTPLVTSLTTTVSPSATMSPDITLDETDGEVKIDIYSTLDRGFDQNKLKEEEEGENDKENSKERVENISEQLDSDGFRKISQTSNASSDLVITKAISEPSICDSTLLHYKLAEDSSEQDDTTDFAPPPPSLPVDKGLDYESSLEKEDDVSLSRQHENSSPIPYEFTESPSENEDQLGSLRSGVMFRNNVNRPRAESWIGRQSLLDEAENEMTQRIISFERKTIYIQKCVNTVAVIVTDTNLPDDKALVQRLWKDLLTHLLYINNTVESCIMENEELYVTGEAVRAEGPKTYQAVFSGMTGNCEVSSATAPYQFRHAARRAHQEYLMNPSLKQLSLCKEYCRMFCQNTLGRESYIHTGRTIVNDSLGTHVALEQHAKAITKQQKLRNSFDCNNSAPNLSFL